MKTKDYEIFLALKRQLEVEITELLPELGIHDCCSPTEYEDDYIRVSGREYWSYGGEDKHSGEIPLDLILDERKEAGQERLAQQERERVERLALESQRRVIRNQQRATNEEEKRRKQYEKLRKEFE